MTSEVWAQVIAGLSGLITTLAVKYLDHILKARQAAAVAPVEDDEAPA